jgi:hypothetical protein
VWSLELTDVGFDFLVLSEFRARLLHGNAEERLVEKLLEWCRTLGLVKARGQQRTDSTHVVAAVRYLNRLELVGETVRARLCCIIQHVTDSSPLKSLCSSYAYGLRHPQLGHTIEHRAFDPCFRTLPIEVPRPELSPE